MTAKSDKVARQLEKLIASEVPSIPELIKILTPEVGRAGEARATVHKVLTDALSLMPTAAVHNSYAATGRAMVELCERTALMAENAVRLLVEPRERYQAAPTGLFEAIEELRGMDLELKTIQIFTVLLLIELITAFESYIRVCEEYLEHPIGSKEMGHRLAAAGKTLVWGIPVAIAKGPIAPITEFGAPILKAGKQLLTSPLVEVKNRVRSGVVEADLLDRFKSNTKQLLEKLPRTEATVSTAALVIATKHDAAAACLESLRPLFEPPSKA